MADSEQNSPIKNAVLTLVSPIADVTAFNPIFQSVITDNPFACIVNMTAGTNHSPVEKTWGAYTARIVNEDGNAKTVGTGEPRFNTFAGFNGGVTTLLAAAAVPTAHVGSVSHDTGHDGFSATLRGHDPNGELYVLNFNRDQVILTACSEEAIRTAVETGVNFLT